MSISVNPKTSIITTVKKPVITVATVKKPVVELKGVTFVKDSTTTNRDDFYQTINLLSELDTDQKKATARENLGIIALPSVETTVSPQAFSACRAVSLVDGVLAYADNLDVHPVIGFTRSAVGAGEPVSVQNSGEIEGFFGLTVGLPIYLASNGTVTQTVPTTGRLQSLGISLTATKVLIQIQQPLFLV